jgi:hypothetical protein
LFNDPAKKHGSLSAVPAQMPDEKGAQNGDLTGRAQPESRIASRLHQQRGRSGRSQKQGGSEKPETGDQMAA